MTDSSVGVYQTCEHVWVPGDVVDGQLQIAEAEAVEAKYLPGQKSKNQRTLDGYQVRILETDERQFFEASVLRTCTNFGRLAAAFSRDRQDR